MILPALSCLLVALFVGATTAVDNAQLRCEVCRRLVEEIQRNVSSVDPSQVVQVANFRLDASGDQPKRTVPLARSQLYLTEVMDAVCTKMEDYVRATYKTNGSLLVMPLLLDGKMNPIMNEVDLVQDSDLNKSLQYYCEEIVNDVEDDLISAVKSEDDASVVYNVCTKAAGLCPDRATRAEL